MAPHKKGKCKYWGKCYRKDAAHKRDFLHPGDDDEEKKDKKTADSGILLSMLISSCPPSFPILFS